MSYIVFQICLCCVCDNCSCGYLAHDSCAALSIALKAVSVFMRLSNSAEAYSEQCSYDTYNLCVFY